VPDAHTVPRLLTWRHSGSLPVIREDKTLVGLVSEYALLQSMIQGRDLKRITAADIMKERVLTVGEETTKHLTVLFRIDVSRVFTS
jgi:predicted transcriptional regulator